MPKTHRGKVYLSQSEAARRIGIAQQNVSKAVKAGRIKVTAVPGMVCGIWEGEAERFRKMKEGKS